MFEKWITDGTASPFYVRKEFKILKPVKSATAKVCGLGQFLFYINGRKVSGHELDPAWTDYHKWIQYVTFDVAGYLHQGSNGIGAEVGNGWYHKTDEYYTFAFPPFMPPNPNPYKPFGKSLVFAMELTVGYEDGTEEVLAADESFKVKRHPVVMSNVYGSETIDGALVQKGWSKAGFDDSDWQEAQPVMPEEAPKGELKNQFQPPVKIIRSYDAKYLHMIESSPAREIYDFGQNMSGMLDFEVKGKKGDSIKVYPAEKLGEDGDVDQMAKNWMMVNSCITYVIGEDDVWEHCRMKFTYFAGRFAAVEKICACEKAEEVPEGAAKGSGAVQEKHEIQMRNFHADAVSSAYKTDGSFMCDDERYMQIYDMIEKTVEANMIGVHTDCPTIERFAWQEPNHLMASSIFYMKDGRKLWEKFLMDMRYAQHKKEDYFLDFAGEKFYPGDGLMPSQCPCYIPNVLPVPGMGSFYDIIPWGSTCILGAYWHYRFYGDRKIIEDNYGAGIRYLRHLQTKKDSNGFISHGLGDWGNPRNDLARENIETAFLFADAKVLAEFAERLGKKEEQKELEEYARRIKEEYNEKLMVRHPEEGFWCYRCFDHPDEIFLTQASQALPLFWGMVPEERIGDITKALRYTLERDGAFICGEVGLPYVIQSACRYGMNDIISKFILKKEHPSYYSFILDGETTLGEYWETNPRSHCHDMMGHIIEWYYNGIAGIIPAEPGFEKVIIKPWLPESIHEFTCAYESVQGPVKVHVKESEKEILLETEAPPGVEKSVDLSNLEQRGKKIVIKIGDCETQ